MTLKELQNEMAAALKAGQKERRTVLSTLVAACNNASITPKGRVEVTEDIVNVALAKEAKIVREQIDTCPSSRTDLLEQYKNKLAIIEEFAPKQITDEATIRNMIKEICTDINPGARKIVMPQMKKAGANMAVVNKVFADMLADKEI